MLTNPKSLFLKIAGVTPPELAELHERLDGLSSLLPKEPPEAAFVSGSGGTSEPAKLQFADLLKSALDKESGTYTVEIRIDAAVDCYVNRPAPQHGRREHVPGLQRGCSSLLLAPRLVLDQILAAFDGLFPEEVELQVLDDK